MRVETVKDMACSGIKTASRMKGFVRKCQQRVCGTVNAATAFVTLCEFRQAINKYSLGGVHTLIAAYAASASMRLAVMEKRSELFDSGGAAHCHTVALFNVIAVMSGYSKSAAAKTTCPATALQVMLSMVQHNLSPKVVLEGIPEWQSLSQSFPVLVSMAMGKAATSRLLEQSVRKLGHTSFKKPGVRKSKRQLLNLLAKGVKDDGSLVMRTQNSYKNLTKRMRDKGGNVNPYVSANGRRVRRRLNVDDMKQWLLSEAANG